ncbi:hypothetical protein OAK75_13950 [Bacteriovoracales bacterium]|nr:hypothetical protein [Bacteriovoracales bacterium]
MKSFLIISVLMLASLSLGQFIMTGDIETVQVENKETYSDTI